MGDSQPRSLEEFLIREVGAVLLLCALALFQTTLLITPLGFSAPLVVVVVICRTLIGVGSAFPDRGISSALRWALYGGLALDVCGATPLGSHALGMLLATFCVALLGRRLRVERLFVPLLAIPLGASIAELVLALIIHPQPHAWGSYSRVIILPVVVTALVMALPLFASMRWMLRREL